MYNFLQVHKYGQVLQVLNQNQKPTIGKSSLDLDSGNDGKGP